MSRGWWMVVAPITVGIFRVRDLWPGRGRYTAAESNQRRRMQVKVLITSAGASLARQLADSLGDDHEILLTDARMFRRDSRSFVPTSTTLLPRMTWFEASMSSSTPARSIRAPVFRTNWTTRCVVRTTCCRRRGKKACPASYTSVRCGSWKVTTRRMQLPSVGNRRPRWSRRSFAVTSARSYAGSSHGSGRSKSRF